jgi:hypothetical protein
MPSINFEEYFKTLENSVSAVAGETIAEYASQAKQDGQNALNLLKSNLEQWSNEVATGQMSMEDLEFLVKGQQELFKMNALEEAGLAAIEIDKFKNSLVNLTLNTLTKFL